MTRKPTKLKPPSRRRDAVKKKLATRGGFRKGQSGNPAGRPKGAINKVTRDIREFCQQLLADDVYQRRFLACLQTGTLAPRLEELVWHYAYGKPAQSFDLKGDGFDVLAAALRGDLVRSGHE